MTTENPCCNGVTAASHGLIMAQQHWLCEETFGLHQCESRATALLTLVMHLLRNIGAFSRVPFKGNITRRLALAHAILGRIMLLRDASTSARLISACQVP